MNKNLFKSMVVCAFVDGVLGKAQKKIAPHQIGKTQTALRYVTIVVGVILLEIITTASEKKFGLDETNGKTIHFFNK